MRASLCACVRVWCLPLSAVGQRRSMRVKALIGSLTRLSDESPGNLALSWQPHAGVVPCFIYFFSRRSGRRIFMNETHPRRTAGAGTVGTLRFRHTAELIHSHPRSGAALIARHAAAQRQCGGSSSRSRSSLLQLTVHPDIRVERKKRDCCN